MPLVMEIRVPNGPTIRVHDDCIRGVSDEEMAKRRERTREIMGWCAAQPGAAERLEAGRKAFEAREKEMFAGEEVIRYGEVAGPPRKI